MQTTLGSAALLCIGVMLVPVALLSLLYAPIVGAAIGIAAVIAMLFGAVGVVGGFR